jgi:hypothetical protein
MTDNLALPEFEFSTEDVQEMLLNIARMLALIPTARLEQHTKYVADSLSKFDSIGILLNPMLHQTGADNVARAEKKMVDALLVARRAIDERESNVAVVQRRSQTLKDTGWFGS